ncbi:MAG TPA: glycoside-pentoside-hexuronide (GPH):cation symporter [Propioniciclava sp.]|jgi:sugar (glycoside-pentoside-hexuronide) transporter|uniref:MFS transporter n=1 Tax=Propioniciclava sp. TaxID=2038686 RepID=UPI002C327C5D|nr:glycoside-pentoside-hexuronide (GPH):cation symporter [Propioniciclava sp.]HRL50329.1 glycoside-pentoside-hexuronide (GPH):cation symporter [Propioniciclava sp.]HRL81306.1 glycoside-pentoside-hexuronide (GPH):cation symporter [Propioniciclava sp.]
MTKTAVPTADERVHLGVWRRLGYASGDFSNNMSWSLVSGYLMFYLTDVALLPAVAVGTMLMVPKAFDAFIDPFIGNMADRTNTRWGRYRPWILFACIPMLILNVLTFSTFPAWSEGGRFAWASVTYVLLVVAYSLVNIPYSALPAALTRDADVRSALASYRMTAAFLSMTLLSFGLIRVVEWAGGGDAALGYQRAAIIFSLIALPFYLITFFSTKEVVHVPHVKVRYKYLFATLKGNAPVWSLVGAFFAWGVLQGGLSMRLYYFTYNAGDQILFANNTTIQSAVSMVGAFAITSLVLRVKNKAVLPAFGFYLAGAACIVCFFLPIDTTAGVWLYYVMSILIGLGQGMILASLFGMVPDTTEYTIWRYKIHAAGFVSAFITFAMKLGTALSAAGAGYVLSWIGYVAGAQQTGSALFWINFSSHIFVGILMLLGGLCLHFYKLDKATYDRIVDELDAQGEGQVQEMA